MPTFLSQTQIYRLLQRESPEGLYADGKPASSLTTAEQDSVAKTLASAYDTMQSIWNNMFIVSSDEQLSKWETALFGETPVGTLTIAQRRQNLLAFLRSQDNISYWTIMQAILGFVDVGTVVQLYQRAKHYTVITAQLKGANADLVWGPDWTAGDPAPAGVTVSDLIRNSETDLLFLRRHAFAYDVVIWGQALSTEDEQRLDDLLTAIEPARSDHTITSYATALVPSTTEVDETNIESFEAAYVDGDSGTGYYTPEPFLFGWEGDDTAVGWDGAPDANGGGYWVIAKA